MPDATPEQRAARARTALWAVAAVVVGAAIGIAVGYGLWHGGASAPACVKRATAPEQPVASCTFCAEPVDRDKPLVVEATRFIVDGNGSASGIVTICNNSAADATLDLAVGDFHGRARDNTLYSIGTERVLSIDGKSASETKTLAPGKCVKVKVDAKGLWQAGLMTAQLLNGKTDLAMLKATRTQVPFGLKVDGATPDKVNVTFTRGHRSYIWLRNDDPMTYRFRWRLEVGDFVETGEEWVEPNRRVGLPVELDCDQFSFLESGFVRTGAKTGNLFVEYEPDASMRILGTPSKRFPVEARLSYWEETRQRISNYVFVLGVLILGILLSLAINYALPTQGKRVADKQRLVDLEGSLAGLGDVIDSRTLALLRVEKKRLRQALRELWPIFPSTDGLLPKLEERIGWLEKRIELTLRTADHLSAIAEADDLTPDEDDEIRSRCAGVLRIVAKPLPTPQDIQGAEGELARAQEIRAGAKLQPSVEAAGRLRERQATLPEDLQTVAEVLRTRFGNILDSLRKDFLSDKPAVPTREQYVRAARAVRKIELLMEFAHLLDTSASDEVRQQREKRIEEFRAALLPGPGESLRRADEIVQEAEQGIDRDVVKAEIEADKLQMDVDPPTPFPYQLVTLRVRARDKPGLESAVARHQVPCRWMIGGEEADERDWTICTYFEAEAAGWRFLSPLRFGRERKRLVEVQATFQKEKDIEVVVHNKVKVEELKSYVESRTLLALATLAITVTIVGIGLLAGALEKLQTLDWITGIVAILALGFGADVLKKIITRS